MVSRELSSEMAFKAFNISMTTSTERDSVEAFTLPDTKYSHGFLVRSNPSIKLAGVNSSLDHLGHSDQ